jgi:hypothetical protein
LDDAEALRRTGSNARANGAMYLGGFVIECLLKAKLLDEFPWLQNAGPQHKADSSRAGRSREDNRLYSLCYQSHDLDEILAKLPGIAQKLSGLEHRESTRLRTSLKNICASWTIYARYSPQSANINDAQDFLEQIKELKTWLV